MNKYENVFMVIYSLLSLKNKIKEIMISINLMSSKK